MRVRFLQPLPEKVSIKYGKPGKNMKKVINFIKSVRSEWFKIVWPTRDTVVHTTIMILVFSGLAALFFFVIDSILNALVNWIF